MHFKDTILQFKKWRIKQVDDGQQNFIIPLGDILAQQAENSFFAGWADSLVWVHKFHKEHGRSPTEIEMHQYLRDSGMSLKMLKEIKKRSAGLPRLAVD